MPSGVDSGGPAHDVSCFVRESLPAVRLRSLRKSGARMPIRSRRLPSAAPVGVHHDGDHARGHRPGLRRVHRVRRRVGDGHRLPQALQAPKPTNARRCWASSAPTRPWSPTGPARFSSGTRTTTAASSRPPWTRPGSGCCARPARTSRTEPAPPVQAPAPDHRVDQRDLRGSARPGTTRRAHPCRRARRRPATHPRADRRDLAQRPHRPTPQALSRRLRSLTPWNRSSRGGPGPPRRRAESSCPPRHTASRPARSCLRQ